MSTVLQNPDPETPTTESLWRSFALPLRLFLRRQTSSDADADDLLQDVFARIHRQLPSLRDTSKLQGWVYRIARNAVIDSYRARRRHVAFEELADTDLETAQPVTEDPTGREAIDLTPSLRRFIESLPVHYREPLVRHEFQGESLADVALALGLSLTAAKSRVRRGRLLLREMLDRCCRFEFDRRGRVLEAIPRNHHDAGTGHTPVPCQGACEATACGKPTPRRKGAGPKGNRAAPPDTVPVHSVAGAPTTARRTARSRASAVNGLASSPASPNDSKAA